MNVRVCDDVEKKKRILHLLISKDNCSINNVYWFLFIQFDFLGFDKWTFDTTIPILIVCCPLAASFSRVIYCVHNKSASSSQLNASMLNLIANTFFHICLLNRLIEFIVILCTLCARSSLPRSSSSSWFVRKALSRLCLCLLRVCLCIRPRKYRHQINARAPSSTFIAMQKRQNEIATDFHSLKNTKG